MSPGRGDQVLSNDHIAMMIIGCLAVGVLYAKRQTLLTGAGEWLRDHQLLTNHNAIITIPPFGGLDLARILVLAGLLVITTVVATVVVRWRRSGAVHG